MFERVQAALFGFDMFISFARRDGTLYAANLAKELAARGFSCSVDLFQSAGGQVVSKIFRPIRQSRAMVIIATPSAAASHYVAAQIEEFTKLKRGLLFVIDIDGVARSAVWYHRVVDRPGWRETRERLAAGEPSDRLIEDIEQAFRVQRRYRQLGQALTFALVAMSAAFLGIAALASVNIRNTSAGGPIPVPMAYIRWVPMAYIRWGLPELLGAIWGSDWTPIASALFLIAIGALTGIAGTIAVSKRKASEANVVAQKVQQAGAAAFYRSFISYSHKDKRFAVRLQDGLKARGVECARDEKDIKPGDDILQAIIKLIEEADKLLLCCSEHSLTSSWVEDEIAAAFEKERASKTNVVIALDLDGYLFDKWKSGLGVRVRRRLAANYTAWEEQAKFDQETDKLVAALKASSPPPA
jgi:hypothetical protein